MKEYHYHQEYNYFCGDSDAHPSPEEPGCYLISAYATEIEPPSCEEGYIQIFNGTSWEIVEDKRGIYFCKETLDPKIIENPLDSIENLTKDVPPLEERLTTQEIKWCCNTNKWIIEDLPEPEIPEPTSGEPEPDPFENMTVQEKLAVIGLTADDLKSLLGIE
jgi:hypothetical protein